MSHSPINNAIPPEIILAIQTMVRQEFGAAIDELIVQKVVEELGKRDDVTRDYLNGKIDQRIMSFSDSGIKTFIQAVIDEMIGNTNSRMRALEDKFGMLLARSMPEYYIKAIDDLKSSVLSTNSDIKMLSLKLDEVIIGRDDSNPSDEEIMKLYKSSDAKIEMIANHFKVSPQQAWKYIHGEIKDAKIRIELKNYLKKKTRFHTSLN